MYESGAESTATRMIFLGESALADAFALIGFETYVDPGDEQVEKILRGLHDGRQKAFVVLGRECSAASTPTLKRLRAEGGRVVISRIPPLNNPTCVRSEVDERIAMLLGNTEPKRS